MRKLKPRIAVMENVQGILWTERSARDSRVSVPDFVAGALHRAGHSTYARLLDAVWYGVPQHRARFFLVAVHRDLGFAEDDFGEWGPFPTPTHGPAYANPHTTVREAISDLPRIANGATNDWLAYEEPSLEGLKANPFLAGCAAEPLARSLPITLRRATPTMCSTGTGNSARAKIGRRSLEP